MNERYPGYDVLAKWDSPSFNDATRAVLAQRLHEVPPRRFFTEEEWDLVDAVCARLLPQPERSPAIPITPWLDEMLHQNRGEGFRHPDHLPMRETWRRGLAALADEARLHGAPFPVLAPAQQDALLRKLQQERVESPLWEGLHPHRFLVQVLLKNAAGIYYAHPAAWNEIGFGGPASPRGYVRLGPDQRDAWEAREVRTTQEDR